MGYAIVFSSRTGNTRQLAEAIRDALPADACVYFGQPGPDVPAADRYYVGFWTDKGSCDEDVAAFLESIGDAPVFLFGTAGFGGAAAYFDKILDSVQAHVQGPVTGRFMCQGRMPAAVRDRYEAMPDSPRRQAMLDNFNAALAHPNKEDLARLRRAVEG